MGVGCACGVAEVGRSTDLDWQAGHLGRAGVGPVASEFICTASPLCPMLREKENQLLVMVSTAMPRCV